MSSGNVSPPGVAPPIPGNLVTVHSDLIFPRTVIPPVVS
jgi:hypothetical protein